MNGVKDVGGVGFRFLLDGRFIKRARHIMLVESHDCYRPGVQTDDVFSMLTEMEL